MKGARPIWRYENSTRVFGVLTSPAQKHLVINELVSGRSLPVLLWPQGKVLGILHVRNWLCLMSTMDILVPEMSIPNEPTLALCPLPFGKETLTERLQILTWSEQAQQEHEGSLMVSWELCCCSYRSPHHPPSRRESSWGFSAVEAHKGLNEDMHSTRSFPN